MFFFPENSKCIVHSSELFVFRGQASHSFTAQYHFVLLCVKTCSLNLMQAAAEPSVPVLNALFPPLPVGLFWANQVARSLHGRMPK